MRRRLDSGISLIPRASVSFVLTHLASIDVTVYSLVLNSLASRCVLKVASSLIGHHQCLNHEPGAYKNFRGTDPSINLFVFEGTHYLHRFIVGKYLLRFECFIGVLKTDNTQVNRNLFQSGPLA